MKTAIKVLIIFGLVIGGITIIPIIVGMRALERLNNATSKEDLKKITIMTLLFCSPIAGILMFFIKFDETKEIKNKDYSLIYKSIIEISSYLVLMFLNIFIDQRGYDGLLIFISMLSIIITICFSFLEKIKITKYFAITNLVMSLRSIIYILYNLIL